MRKSSRVPLRILSTLAEFLRGPLAVEESRYCVDENGRIVPDVCCENSTLGVTCHWVYGGASTGKVGDTVEGGSRERTVYNPGFGARHGGGG
jgi:hypothetical protein